MPRFMNTWTGEFESHHDPRYARYAILSHVWRTPQEGGEQTFEDVRSIQAAVREARDNSDQQSQPIDWPTLRRSDDLSTTGNLYRDIPEGVSVIFSSGSPLSDKTKGLCKVARDAGFDLVWSDACCIDKTSSAELSEAINSMYEWYRLSDMCYVYLADVSTSDSTLKRPTRFGDSRWHTRGWTLQELIAPERVEFLTRDWAFLGTKLGLVGALAEITGIDVDVLTGRAPVTSASVAQKMSWAASRTTTRVEDRAYCLMGLFGIHMSPIYGEGSNAFLRLQEEIVKTVPDQSIFAWGNTCYLNSLHLNGWETSRGDPFLGASSLLAPSPSRFSHVRPTMPIPPQVFASRLRLRGPKDIPSLQCVFTPEGVRVRLLCLDLKAVPHIWKLFRICSREGVSCDDCRRLETPDMLALLRCGERSKDGKDPRTVVALPLRSSSAFGYERGCTIRAWQLPHARADNAFYLTLFQTIVLRPEALAGILDHVRPTPVELSILHHNTDRPILKGLREDYGGFPRLDLTGGTRRYYTS